MDLVTQLSTAQLAVLGAVIAGATELINRLRAKDYWVAITIATAAILGGFIGWHYGIDFVDGMAAGLGTSGAFSFAGMFKGKSSPAPSNPVTR